MSAVAVELDVIVTGEVPTPHAYVFRPDGGNALTRLASVLNPRADTLRCPCLAYVLRHPAAGAILIDTGFHPDASRSLRADFGIPMSLMFRQLRPAAVPYVEQLRELGVEAGDVSRVVMTHLHVDHTSGMRLLPAARFTCSEREWRAATGRSAATGGYVARHLPPEARMDLVDIDSVGERFRTFGRTVDLLGDGSIRVISTPGHTRGHTSVLVETTRGPVLIAADAVYTLRNLSEEILPLLTVDDEAYLRSVRELKAFSEQDPAVPVVPTHDPDAWRQL